METFSALLAICAGNSAIPSEFPTQRPVTRSFDVFLDLRLYKRLSKQSRGWWFETLSRPLWRHCNVMYFTACRPFGGMILITCCLEFVMITSWHWKLSASLALYEGNPGSPVDYLTKGQWCGALMVSSLLASPSCWTDSQVRSWFCTSLRSCYVTDIIVCDDKTSFW